MSTRHKTLTPELLARMDAYWRAANYLAVGQIYLCDNPLLRRPLALSDIKHMLLGHWGTTPGQNFIYVHLNRVINKYDRVLPVNLQAVGFRHPASRQAEVEGLLRRSDRKAVPQDLYRGRACQG